MHVIGLSHGRPKLRKLTCCATLFALVLAQASFIGTASADAGNASSEGETTPQSSSGDGVSNGAGPTCGGRPAFDPSGDWPVIREGADITLRDLLRQPVRTRVPGQGADGTDASEVIDETRGRWLEGYRPTTVKAWREFEAWKKEQRRTGASVPMSPGFDPAGDFLQPADPGEPAARFEPTHYVHEELYEGNRVDLREIDLSARLPEREPRKPGKYHLSGMTLEEYRRLKELAKSGPGDPEAQEAEENLTDAPTGPMDTFDAIAGNGTSAPPDPIMAAGPNHLIAVVNSDYRVYDISGGTWTSSPISLVSLFSSETNCVNGSNLVFDVFVDYDEAEDRFVMGATSYNGSNPRASYLCVAATTTGDPTTSWHTYSFRADAVDNSVWVDYPHMAIGQDAVYIAGNMFPDGGGLLDHVNPWALDKSDLYSGTALTVAESNIGGGFVGVVGVDQPVRPGSRALWGRQLHLRRHAAERPGVGRNRRRGERHPGRPLARRRVP
jgi:hypothetical protein